MSRTVGASTAGIDAASHDGYNSYHKEGARQTDAQMTMKKCPIEGCSHVFAHGIRGWDAHVAKVDNHPTWKPRLRSMKGRKDAFSKEFPAFFQTVSVTPPAMQAQDRKISGTFEKFQAIVDQLDRIAKEAEALTKTA